MLKNAYLLAKIGADTAENEEHFAAILPTNWAAVAAVDQQLRACAASDTRRCADTSFGGLSEIQKENVIGEFMGMGPVESWDETHISRRVREVALTVPDS